MNRVVIACVVAVSMAVDTAQANPFHIGRFGGLHAGPANQGAYAVYWNPGYLGQPDGHVQLHILGVNRHATYRRIADDADDEPGLMEANAGRNQTGALGVVPSLAFRYGRPAGDFDMGLGVSGFVERAGKTAWRKSLNAPIEYPGALDGPQRWSTINTRMLILTGALGAGATYRPWRLSLGVTAGFNAARLSTLRARNPDSSERLIDEAGRLAEGRILLEDGADEGLSWIVGAAWTPTDSVRIAVAWQSAVDYELTGKAYITFGLAPETTVNAAFNLPVPQSLRAESEITLSSTLKIRPLFGWVQWSDLEAQEAYNVDENSSGRGEVLMRLERQFKDILFGRVAVDYQWLDSLGLTVSGAYETGATPTETFDPGLAESDHWELGAGAQWQIGSGVRLDVSFIWQQFMDVSVSESIQKPTTNGHYTDQRQYVALDLGFDL